MRLEGGQKIDTTRKRVRSLPSYRVSPVALVSRYGTPAVRFQKNGRVFTRPCGCCSVRWLTLMVLCSGSLNQALVEQPEMVSARSRNVARRSDDMQNVLVNRMVDGL